MTANYVYKVVPFIGQIKENDKQGAAKVAGQLQQLLDTYAAEGWEFYRIDQVQIAIRPGCLSALLGGRINYINFDQVIFRKEQ